jgi:hypothetical protein
MLCSLPTRRGIQPTVSKDELESIPLNLFSVMTSLTHELETFVIDDACCY